MFDLDKAVSPRSGGECRTAGGSMDRRELCVGERLMLGIAASLVLLAGAAILVRGLAGSAGDEILHQAARSTSLSDTGR
jgi:hypothetical protein